jgi:hypothetical protein
LHSHAQHASSPDRADIRMGRQCIQCLSIARAEWIPHRSIEGFPALSMSRAQDRPSDRGLALSFGGGTEISGDDRRVGCRRG